MEIRERDGMVALQLWERAIFNLGKFLACFDGFTLNFIITWQRLCESHTYITDTYALQSTSPLEDGHCIGSRIRNREAVVNFVALDLFTPFFASFFADLFVTVGSPAWQPLRCGKEDSKEEARERARSWRKRQFIFCPCFALCMLVQSLTRQREPDLIRIRGWTPTLGTGVFVFLFFQRSFTS